MLVSSSSSPIFAGREKTIAITSPGTGQSNYQGRGLLASSPISNGVKIGSIKTWRRGVGVDSSMYSGTGKWYDLEYDTNQYEGRGEFGSILQYAIKLRDNLENKYNRIYFLSPDGNGKPIAGWLNSGAEALAMYNEHFTPALASLGLDPTINEIRVLPFYFDQGESDGADLTESNAYEVNEAQLVSDIRSYFGVAALPMIVRQMDSTVPRTYIETIRTAKANNASADSNLVIISGPYTYNVGDPVHLDGAAQIVAGNQRWTETQSLSPTGELYSV